MVSVSLAELVWPPTVTLAVLVRVSPGLPVRVALMVNVTLPLTGIEGIVMPAPCMSATVGEAGQVAPPEAEQLTLLAVIPVTAGSLKTALLKVSFVVLVMVTI